MVNDIADGTVADRRVHPATVPLRLLKNAPSTLLGLPAAFAYMSEVGWPTLLGFTGGVAAVVGLFNWLAWRRFRYGVGAGELVIESGIFSRTRRSIPFDRIQDVDIERGPLHRLFGLAKVRIETGGAGGNEGVLDSVALAEAGRLRAAVRAGRAQGLARDSSEEQPVLAETRTVFRMGLARVLFAGMFNFSLIWIAGMFALLQALGPWLPFEIDNPGSWIGYGNRELTGRLSAAGIIGVLLLALVLGVVTGIARTVARDWGFRLTVEGARFHRVRGLFTRSEVVLGKARVQLARVGTGPLRSRLGWSELSFQSLGTAEGGSGAQAVAPFATTPEIEHILAEQGALRLPGETVMTMVSSRHLWRALLPKVLLPAAIMLAGALVWLPALLFLPLLAPAAVVALLERRCHRYALADGLLFIRRGVWRRQLWIVPASRIQSITRTRSFLQRRLGLATLAFDTAGAPVLGGPAIVDLRDETAHALVETLKPPPAAAQLSGRKSGTER